MGGCEVPAADVTPTGLAGDRHWMLVDANGRFISQREQERLALIAVSPTAEGLIARAPGRSDIEIAPPGVDGAMPVTIWDDQLAARVAPPAVNAWFSDFLGVACRLVFQGDSIRPVDPRWSKPGDSTSFADAYPLLVCTTGSLADLGRRLGQPLPMNRFRPNLVIADDRPWSEDEWQRLRIGTVEIDLVKPCARCVVTTVDQAVGVKTGQEPLRTLAKFRFLQVPGISGVIFGQNAIPRVLGRLSAGDPVEVLQRQPKPLFKQAALAS
jgi:uncharacterized protein